MKIRKLSSHLISQIAAGEMIFSPAQVIKELTENSIDSGADRIMIELSDGGRERICVKDNGCGIPRSQLSVSVERHTTSKLNTCASVEEINAIKTRGFRGEALASIAVSSRLTMITKVSQEEACSLCVDQGDMKPIVSATHGPGTSVLVENLFENMPVRKRFLPSTRACLRAVQKIFKYQALSRMNIGFHLKHKKTLYHFPPHTDQLPSEIKKMETPLRQRARLLFPNNLFMNAHFVRRSYKTMMLWGLVLPPPETARNTDMQYFFVNGRAIKDRFLSWLLRSAFFDVLEHGRHPIAILFLCCAPEDVDINVHPTKEKVLFVKKQSLRTLFFDTLKTVLAPPSHIFKDDPKHVDKISQYMKREPIGRSFLSLREQNTQSNDLSSMPMTAPSLQGILSQEEDQDGSSSIIEVEEQNHHHNSEIFSSVEKKYPLGRAIAQIHQTYIIAQSVDTMILVDQHAAHERVVYEGMKCLLEQKQSSNIRKLLIPEVVSLLREEVEILLSREDELKALGISVESFGDSVVVRSLPSVLSKRINIQELIKNLVADFMCWKTSHAFDECVKNLCGNIACKNSIKAGTFLTLEQMNALLRAMEKTPKAAYCNHGRPTYIHLSRNHLDTLFHRR